MHRQVPASDRYVTSFGLPLCMSLIASYIRKTIPQSSLYLGEVDLFRNVLPVPLNVLQDLSEGQGIEIHSAFAPELCRT